MAASSARLMAPASPEQPSSAGGFGSLEGRAIRYRPSKRGPEILHGIHTGCLETGTLCAVMGASGSGKTTLLKVLGGRLRESCGQVLVNGAPRATLGKSWKQVASLIPQEDVLPRSLTPRQVLYYQALLCGQSQAGAKVAAQEVMDRLRLGRCADTRIGDGHTLQGLSGGERKRCSVALELLKKPRVLLLDEPTSGLDGPLAYEIVAMLSALCRGEGSSGNGGILAVCTIHQPSSKVFGLFDQLLLLREGETVYRGQRDQAEAFFARLGHQLPPQTNPAEHFMELLQSPEGPPAVKEAQADSLEEAAAPNGLEAGVGMFPDAYGVPFVCQTYLLLRRTMLMRILDPAQFKVRALLSTVVATILGFTYFRVSDKQGTVYDRQSVIFGCLVFLTLNTLVTTAIQFPLEKAFVFREYHNGTYKLAAWYVANMITSLILQLLFSTLYVVVLYYLVGLRPETPRFLVFLSVSYTMGSIGVVLGTVLGIALPAVHMVTSVVAPLIMPQLIFSGFMIRPGNIPIYFKWLYYLSFFQYSFQLMMISQFEGFMFEPCNFGEFCPLGLGPQAGDGWLTSVLNYDLDGITRCWCILALMFVVFLIAGYWVTKLKARRG